MFKFLKKRTVEQPVDVTQMDRLVAMRRRRRETSGAAAAEAIRRLVQDCRQPMGRDLPARELTGGAWLRELARPYGCR